MIGDSSRICISEHLSVCITDSASWISYLYNVQTIVFKSRIRVMNETANIYLTAFNSVHN